MIKSLFIFLLLAGTQIIKAQNAADYDNLIVPGQRIGPVSMGGYVDEIVRKLGKPNKIRRNTFRGPGYDADEVYYSYKKNGNWFIWFTWEDKGFRPVVESGLRGINTQSNYWVTAKGVHVGSSAQDVVIAYGEPYHYLIEDKQESVMEYDGIWFWVKDRESPVYQISIVPPGKF